MSQAKKGDRVEVHYKGFLDDGTVFDTSIDREPLSFKLGEKRVIAGFEKAVEGMTEGDKKTIAIPPEEAYGMPRKELVLTVNKSELPEDISPELGMKLKIRGPENDNLVVSITEITDDTITIDGNHPLAGENLNFEIELVKISA
jgi:peptidylprolyl isomerase